MSNYLNNTYLKQAKNKNMPIVQALLKYGQENFALLIVEYVSTSLPIPLGRVRREGA